MTGHVGAGRKKFDKDKKGRHTFSAMVQSVARTETLLQSAPALTRSAFFVPAFWRAAWERFGAPISGRWFQSCAACHLWLKPVVAVKFNNPETAMSNSKIFPPRCDDPSERCHILFTQIHSLLTILIMLTASKNLLGWGRNENNLFFLLQEKSLQTTTYSS